MIIIFNVFLDRQQFKFVSKIIVIFAAVISLATLLEIHFQKHIRRFFSGPPIARYAA